MNKLIVSTNSVEMAVHGLHGHLLVCDSTRHPLCLRERSLIDSVWTYWPVTYQWQRSSPPNRTSLGSKLSAANVKLRRPGIRVKNVATILFFLVQGHIFAWKTRRCDNPFVGHGTVRNFGAELLLQCMQKIGCLKNMPLRVRNWRNWAGKGVERQARHVQFCSGEQQAWTEVAE